MAAPVVESFTIYEAASALNVHTINAPASIAEGDLLVQVWCVRATNGDGRVFDTGWTERVFLVDAGGPNNEYIAVGTKRATASEPATYDFQVATSNARPAVGFCVRISGDDDSQANPIHASGTTDESSASTSRVAPSVNTTEDDCLIFYALSDSDASGTAYTEDAGEPAGTTLIGLRQDDGNIGAWGALAYKTLASAGASGTGTFTSDESGTGVLATFAIAPAAAGRIMSSLAGAGGLAGPGGLAGAGGGLAG